MKLYITGIAGLLGNNIVKKLVDRCEITGVDIIDLNIPNITYQSFSLYETEKLKEHIALVKPDAVIHTAAAVNVDECEENPEWAYKLNDEVTGQIAEICHDLGIKLVYISSDAVFDGEDEKLYIETDSTNPLNVYAKTKLGGEQHVLKSERNLVLRTNIYGHNIQDKKSFGEWVVSSLEEGKTLNMFEDIDFSPILVTDLAEIIYKSLENNLCGLYHVCATGCISKYEFGIKMKEIFDLHTGVINKTQSETMHFKAKRSKHMGMSNEKICKELGIKIRTPEESINEFKRLYDEIL
ncbi:MAG: NAD(P)-dependent oxidoreductase [Lachnospiraceae bacterium]|nr:NAD(P)-dependent oxidoreductase [Lachnospiraceae bacterium]